MMSQVFRYFVKVGYFYVEAFTLNSFYGRKTFHFIFFPRKRPNTNIFAVGHEIFNAGKLSKK